MVVIKKEVVTYFRFLRWQNIRASYVVSFVGLNPYLYLTSVVVELYEIERHMGSCYNSFRLYNAYSLGLAAVAACHNTLPI